MCQLAYRIRTPRDFGLGNGEEGGGGGDLVAGEEVVGAGGAEGRRREGAEAREPPLRP